MKRSAPPKLQSVEKKYKKKKASQLMTYDVRGGQSQNRKENWDFKQTPWGHDGNDKYKLSKFYRCQKYAMIAGCGEVMVEIEMLLYRLVPRQSSSISISSITSPQSASLAYF